MPSQRQQYLTLKKELFRKSVHLSFCVFALFCLKFKLSPLCLVLIPAAFVGFFIENSTHFKKRLSLGSERRFGAILLAIGLSLIVFSPTNLDSKIFAILVLAIADLGASIVGKLAPIKSTKILETTKSLGGSLTFAVGVFIALALSFGFRNPYYSYPIIIAFLTFVELFNWRSIDNLTLPILSLILGGVFFG